MRAEELLVTFPGPKALESHARSSTPTPTPMPECTPRRCHSRWAGPPRGRPEPLPPASWPWSLPRFRRPSSQPRRPLLGRGTGRSLERGPRSTAKGPRCPPLAAPGARPPGECERGSPRGWGAQSRAERGRGCGEPSAPQGPLPAAGTHVARGVGRAEEGPPRLRARECPRGPAAPQQLPRLKIPAALPPLPAALRPGPCLPARPAAPPRLGPPWATSSPRAAGRQPGEGAGRRREGASDSRGRRPGDKGQRGEGAGARGGGGAAGRAEGPRGRAGARASWLGPARSCHREAGRGERRTLRTPPSGEDRAAGPGFPVRPLRPAEAPPRPRAPGAHGPGARRWAAEAGGSGAEAPRCLPGLPRGLDGPRPLGARSPRAREGAGSRACLAWGGLQAFPGVSRSPRPRGAPGPALPHLAGGRAAAGLQQAQDRGLRGKVVALRGQRGRGPHTQSRAAPLLGAEGSGRVLRPEGGGGGVTRGLGALVVLGGLGAEEPGPPRPAGWPRRSSRPCTAPGCLPKCRSRGPRSWAWAAMRTPSSTWARTTSSCGRGACRAGPSSATMPSPR